ncbi:alpha/beta hydrolase [Aestuariimicrobium ganziense]|uniref:alpha/beta hydrolase n=1 Tax=Aestuariimicrobium ganziense TaxID=2773677 RepID=UPI00194139D6|nr:esterase [Aestuariimicrobium ganziense]
MATTVHPDRTVTFTLAAPEATSVGLVGGWLPWPPEAIPMAKDDDGIWSLTVGPLPPEWYEYHFVVDGVPTADPDNPTVVQAHPQDTMLMVPGPGTEFFQERDVPHGRVEPLTYHSEVVGTERRAMVWSPPRTHDEPLPLLVLMHGGGGDELDWVVQGRAPIILDNLLADGAITPMLVVMPAMMLSGNVGPGQLVVPPADKAPDEIVDNLLPAIEKAYPVATDPSRRALAGLSMGGFFTWDTLIMRPGVFAWYGDFSSGYFPDGIDWLRTEGRHLLDNPAINDQTILHAIYCDEMDAAWPNNVNTRAVFDEFGVSYTFIEVEGTNGHTFTSWRRHLRDLAPRVFRS